MVLLAQEYRLNAVRPVGRRREVDLGFSQKREGRAVKVFASAKPQTRPQAQATFSGGDYRCSLPQLSSFWSFAVPSQLSDVRVFKHSLFRVFVVFHTALEPFGDLVGHRNQGSPCTRLSVWITLNSHILEIPMPRQ